MKRKIYLTLFGGLGNQLFQYACALNLSREIGADLVIDHISDLFLIENLNVILIYLKTLMLRK